MKYFFDTEFHESFHKPLFGKRRHYIDLISIGIHAEDGRYYYAISKDFCLKSAWKNEWVRENVLKNIYTENCFRNGEQRVNMQFSEKSLENLIKWVGKSNDEIAKDIFEFVNPNIQDLIYTYTRHDCWSINYYPKEFEYIQAHNTKMPEYYYKSGSGGYEKNRAFIYNQPEFYAYYADYDWVVFCSLFGTMMDLPKGFPMYCRDLKQTFDEKVLQIGHSADSIKNRDDYPRQKNEHNALADAKWNYELYKFLQSAI